MSSIAIPQPTTTMETLHLTVDGFDREALVFVPGSMPQPVELPVVFVFHGHGGTMTSAALHMGIHILWPEAIVVYPQGLPTPSAVDPLGHQPGWQSEANQPTVGNRDLHLVDALLARLGNDHVLHPKRMYVCGFSNGAVFSYLLWAKMGTKIAAVGECAGRTLPPTHLTVPRPLLAIAGRADHVCNFADQEATIGQAREVDQAEVPQSCGQANPADPLSPECTLYSSPLHTPVKTLIHDGGHIYPSWASAEIVNFLKAHPLP